MLEFHFYDGCEDRLNTTVEQSVYNVNGQIVGWVSVDTMNAKLREELEAVGTAAYLYGRTDLADENAKLRKMVSLMYKEMQGVLDRSTDTVWVDKIATLRDCMDIHMEKMAELGIPPRDYKDRMRELGIEVDG